MWVETKDGNLVNLDMICALLVYKKYHREEKFCLVGLLPTSSGYEGDFSSDEIVIWEGSEEECRKKIEEIKEAFKNKNLILKER